MGQIAKVGSLEVYALSSDDARSWELFPHAIFRAARFSREYDSDADIVLMVAQLKQAFIMPNGPAKFVLMLKDGKVVGHLLVTMEEWFGTHFATIVQLETDVAGSRTLYKEALDWVDDWAKKHGAAFMQCLARNDKVARAFSIFHGFERNRIIMRKPLSTDVAESPESA